jgi:hypothetical protein
MERWSLHRIFPSLDIHDIPRHLNHFSHGWVINFQNFDRDTSSAIAHVVNLLKYVSKMNATHRDVLIRLFLISLETRQSYWVEHILHPKSISSLEIFIEKFLKMWASITQRYEYTFHDITMFLQREVLCFIHVE